jgi:hypothetical protein
MGNRRVFFSFRIYLSNDKVRRAAETQHWSSPLADGEHADAYFGLKESLASLVARPIDLVMTNATRNRYFLETIDPTRTLMYAA